MVVFFSSTHIFFTFERNGRAADGIGLHVTFLSKQNEEEAESENKQQESA